MKALLREPLLHFLVLGTAIFAVSAWFSEPFLNEPDEIVVSAEKVEWLAGAWQARWQRQPIGDELERLVDDHIIEEIFYREALALGLDRDDTVIRRRLRQKMEFLSQDLADLGEPTDEELQRFFAANHEKYRTEDQLTFRHIYLNAERRGADADDDARRLLSELNALPRPAKAELTGDPFLLPHYFETASQSEVAKNFGAAFARELLQVEAGRWTGPIESGYGLHLVFVHDRIAGGPRDLSEVRDRVEREWRVERREKAQEAFYGQLRERYRIRIDWPEWAEEFTEARR